ncbi:alpha/beta hydrolase [Alloscardovia venturai]|uniref:Alpha/beta hydrolase n=1 Tax=Alloscardovia venturai TaxID=1769421 RepID=A0ABW2Y480_9BIFI
MKLTTAIMKALFDFDDLTRDRALSMPIDVVRFTNITYGTKRPYQQLDVYHPAEEFMHHFTNEHGEIPVIVSVHGGGWIHGSKDTYQYYCMDMARRGFAVVNFSYGLAPQYKFPVFLEDTVQAFDWVYVHARQYNFDTHHVYAIGDSAGANILGLYCALATNSQFAQRIKFDVYRAHVPQAIALSCGVYKTDIKHDKKHTQTMQDDLYSDVFEPYGKYSQRFLMNVTDYVTESFPPTLVITSTGDFLQMQAPLLVHALQKAHVPVKFTIYGTQEDKDKYPHVFHLDIKSTRAMKCNDDQIEFFRQHS